MADVEEEQCAPILFLTRDQVLILHRYGIERYTPGEPREIINESGLQSALQQPEQTWDGQYIYDIAKMAAAYMFSFASNHAFLQGNKRLALATCSTFLRINGYRLTLTEDEGADLVLRIVNGRIEQDQVAEILGDAMVVM